MRIGWLDLLRRRCLLPILLLAVALWTPVSLHAQDEPAPDTAIGELTLPVTRADGPAPTVEGLRVLEIARGMAGRQIDWGGEYQKDQGGKLTDAGRTTLEVALADGYERKQIVKDLKDGGDRTAPLVRNLDVGRHEVMKALYHQAFVMANERLKKEGRSPLERVVPVNAGGTGDFTRDQDITAFVSGDEHDEKVYFECLEKAAESFTIGGKKLVADRKDTGGIDFPQIEVTVFPGRNDTPDPRFATDVETFRLTYSKVLRKQTQDLEAYIGGGTDIEVKGRRRPGQMHVQEISRGPDGSVRYRAETPGNFREALAIFTDYGQERFDNWQRASHIFSDYIQAYRHWKHGETDPTKGPLKYLGRAAEQLCLIHGKKPWPDLTNDEKLSLLTMLYPQHSRDNAAGQKILQRMLDVIDVAVDVKTTKKLPGGANGELGSRIALVFLRKTFAATAGKMAQDWLQPPPFHPSMLRPGERARWDALTPAERHIEALERSKIYAECVSHAAMENLVLTMAMLRQMDQDEGRTSGPGDGEAAIRQMIDSERAPSVKAVLEIADELSRAYLAQEQSPTPEAREKSRQKLAALRKKLKPFLAPGQDPPGEKLLVEMEKLGPKLFLEEDMASRRSPMGAAIAEMRARFEEHMKQAFPSTAEQWKGFREDVAQRGWKGYAARKLLDEAFQLDTISDALTLVEMYQNDATLGDYAVFVSVNVLSRFHWSFSHLYAAWNVRTTDDLVGLGKSLVFVTLSRVIPGAGNAKILFDITAGLVRVTVGWSVKVVNAELVDAIYTGEAGRRDEDTEAVVGTRNRFSSFEILPPEFVLRVDEEVKDRDGKRVRTGKKIVVIDRPGVYRRFFEEWTGIECDDRHPMRSVKPGASILVNANDRVADLLLAQAEEYGRTWVSADAKPPLFKPELKAADVASALTTLHQSFVNWGAMRVKQILDEGAFRTYVSYFDKVDVIEAGLVQRFASDLLAGMIEHWTSYYTARILAMREIERTACLADLSAAAESLQKRRHEAIVGPPPPPDKRPPVSYELDVAIHGRKLGDSDEYDGAVPVRVSAFLKGDGEVGEREEEVTIEVRPAGARIVEKGKDAKGGDATIEPGDLIEHRIEVFATQAGKVLAVSAGNILVRMPGEVEEGARKVAVYRHEERARDGTLRERYTYFKRFDGMPGDWQSEYGQVYHGPYERFYGDGTRSSEETYEHGILSGEQVSYDPQGRWTIKTPYVNGKIQGTRIHRDPDSQSRHEMDHEAGEVVEERSYSTTGQVLRKVTYTYSGGGESQRVSGEYLAFWPDGTLRFKGRYQTDSAYAVVASERGGAEGETAPGKQGVWEIFHPNGKPEKRETFVDNVLEGPFERFDENDTLVARGQFREGRMSGAWVERNAEGGRDEGTYEEGRRQGSWNLFDEKQRPAGSVEYEAGEKVRGRDVWYHENGKVRYDGRWTEEGQEGECLSYHESGELDVKTTYRNGRREGPYEERGPDGRVVAKGAYHDDEKEGPWTEPEDSYGEVGSGQYAAGHRDGRWEFRDGEGKRRRWASYRGGEVIEKGSYDD